MTEAEIERLQAIVSQDADVMRTLFAEIERLQKHKRAQAEDIMTLGQQVGKLEAEIKRLQEKIDDYEMEAEAIQDRAV